MKKIISFLLILTIALTSFSPTYADAAAAINKVKATMEIDSTLKLKITGTSSKITWKSSKPSVASVSSSGTVTAKKKGSVSITATVNSKKFTCKITIIDSNGNNSNTNTKTVKNAKDFEQYLQETYSSIKTDFGTVKFEYTIIESNYSFTPNDYSIWVDWNGISPFDIEYSKSYSEKQKSNTKRALRDLQIDIYNDAITFFPNKKFEGCYISTWYDYPSLQVGFNSIRFLSWQNFDDSGDIYAYKTSKLSEFKWTPKYDDYDFTN